jgi:hypothetical protein
MGWSAEHPALALTELESLLRQLRWCRTCAEAEALVGARLTELTGARRVLLYVTGPDGVRCDLEAGAELRSFAASTVATGHARGTVIEGEGTLALPLTSVTSPVGALVLVHGEAEAIGDRELALVRLFAEHAGAALRRLTAPVAL